MLVVRFCIVRGGSKPLANRDSTQIFLLHKKNRIAWNGMLFKIMYLLKCLLHSYNLYTQTFLWYPPPQPMCRKASSKVSSKTSRFQPRRLKIFLLRSLFLLLLNRPEMHSTIKKSKLLLYASKGWRSCFILWVVWGVISFKIRVLACVNFMLLNSNGYL